MSVSDADLLASIKTLAQEFQYTAPQQCQLALCELLGKCKDRGTDLPPDICKALLQFAVSVVAPRCAVHRPLQWPCLEVIGLVGRAVVACEELANRTDLHGFFLRLAKKECKSQPVWKPRVLVLMLQHIFQWSQTVDLAGAMSMEGDGGVKPDLLSALMEALYGEMEGSRRWKPRWRLKASRALRKVLNISPQVREHAAGWLRKAEHAPALLVAVLAAESAALPEPLHRDVLLEVYVKQVLESKQPLPEASLQAWAPALGLATEADVEKQLLPVVLRMSKRHQAAIACSFPSMTTHVNVDLSKHAKEILDPFALEILKDKDKRPGGCCLIEQVARKSKDLAAPLALATAWAEGLKKAGKNDDKQAGLAAVATLALALPRGTEGTKVADAVKPMVDPKGIITKIAGEDANEETRGLGYRALAALLAHLPAGAQEPALKELLKPFADKKAPDRAKIVVLQSLLDLVTSTSSGGSAASPPWAALVLEKVVPLLLIGATKPVQRFQSLLAWAVCGALVATDKDGLAAHLKKDHLAALKEGVSFVNATPTILKAPAGELVAQAQLWGNLLCGSLAGMPSLSAAAGTLLGQGGGALRVPPSPISDALPLCRTAVMLLAMLHEKGAREDKSDVLPASSAGRGAPKPAERIGLFKASGAISEGEFKALVLLMAHALLAWLSELNQLPSGQRQASSDALRSTLLDLCAAAARAKAAPHPETIALFAVAAYHPLINSGKRPAGNLWRRICAKEPFAGLLQRAPDESWQCIREAIMAGCQVPADDRTGFRTACVHLADTLDSGMDIAEGRKDVVQGEIEAIFQQCVDKLHSSEVAAEKERNVEIYYAPENRLWVEKGTYVAEEREDKNLKKNKFLKGLYGDDDIVIEKAGNSKFAPPDRNKAKAKAKSKAGGDKPAGSLTGSEIEEAKMAEQAETRARIRGYVDEASFALGVLSIISRSEANLPVLENSIPGLVPHLLKLLKSPLTVVQARACLRCIVHVVPEYMVARRDLLPDALTVVSKGWLERLPSAAGTPGDRPICDVVLDGVGTKHSMPLATISLVLPMLLRPLFSSGPTTQKLCARALLLLEQQLVLGVQIPDASVREVFEAFGVALMALSGQRGATQAAMNAAARYLVSTEDQLVQLTEMFFADEEVVRATVMAAIAELRNNTYVNDGSLDPIAAHAVLRLGAIEAKTKELATETIEALELETDAELVEELIAFVSKKTHIVTTVKELIAKAIAEVLIELEDAEKVTAVLNQLTQLFREDAAARVAVARCLEQIFGACLEEEEQVISAFRFLLRQGLGLTIGGTKEAIELRDVLLGAGIALIERHGEEHADVLFGAIEDFEQSGAGAAAGESARLGVAVFLGALSKHLSSEHEKLPEILPMILKRLLDPASTSSVQNAIVKVMPPLMKQNREQATETLEQLLETALTPKTHEVTRRGAAMGLGATVKGLSIQAVSQHGILKKIETATENKKDSTVREGALLCLEGLTTSLGRLFDPYVVTSLPWLLRAFADPAHSVQAASRNAANAMMAQVSGPGVKQVLKPVLEGIKDKKWQTKLGSIEMLAAMTSCLPKQLGACLPQVVPALCLVINDPHSKVKDAAREGLDKIGSIIASPELRALAPELIAALTDGAQFEHITREVLDKLLGTSFVHQIDAASLSLVCPLVQRALRERSGEMKRKGAHLVGSMVLLIKDPKDIQPYLPLLLPQLKVTLVDPIPDVRATAAMAFGTLAKSLPEEMLGDVLPWLFQMLRSTESSVERSGAAHGLSEVLMAMGTDRIEMLLPDIIANANSREAAPEVREGYIGLFVYLPAAMGGSFEPYIAEVLTLLLRARADDTSSVRDTASRAAQVLVKQFGASHTALLLPPLEDGVFDLDWRIRLKAVQLTGQLIEQILRMHGIPTNSAELMQCEVLPKEWRAHMLASLYIVRSDENGDVKKACAQVWKAVVQNTPRTLKDLLPTLMTRLIANLASTNREKQRVAARCVGDLVGKLGERVMPELMPIFMNTLSTGDAHVREGVCIGLAELINATTKQLLADYLGELIPAIRKAIIDDVETVRESASLVVALLHNAVGPRATTDVVAWVLAQLQEGEVEEHGHLFLNGLEQLMAKQPAAVLPIVLARLATPAAGEDGWTKLQLQGLATIAVVPDGHTVHRHLSDVLPVIIDVASDEDTEQDLRDVAIESAGRVMMRVEQVGLHLLIRELLAPVQSQALRRRATGSKLFEYFFEHTALDVVSLLPQALPAILPIALADEDAEALAAGMRALNAIVKKCKKEELTPHLAEVRGAVLELITDPVTKRVERGKLLPGLCRHNGVETLYPIYQHALMYGSSDARELAAKGVGELVDHTTEAALKPYVVKITGPLIRTVGDRLLATVKTAIVDALKSLLIRGGANLKPFLPQLQTTYLKCLADPSEAVREKAAISLGTLVRLSARTEQLITELVTSMTKEDDAGNRSTTCIALAEVLLNVPQAVGEATQDKLLDVLLARLEEGGLKPRDREVAASAFALFLRRHCSAERAAELLQEHVVPGLQDSDAAQRHSAAFTLAGACWCQAPQMPAPPPPLLDLLQELIAEWLPKLLADKDRDVQSAAMVLFATATRLSAEASLPCAPLQASSEKFVALAASDALPNRIALRAARHCAAAASQAGTLSIGAKLAAAIVRRNVEKDIGAPEDLDRALAAALGVKEGGEGETKTALEELLRALDKPAATPLRDYAQKHLRAIMQMSGDSDFVWDF